MKQQMALCLAGLLTACGGGDSAPAAGNAAEGLWATAGSGAPRILLVLDNGETWGLVAASSTPLSIERALRAQSSASEGVLAGSGREFGFVAPRVIQPVSYNGSVSAGSKLQVTASTSAVLAVTGYTANGAYGWRASLPALAGTFSGPGVSAIAPQQTQTVTVWPTGALSVPAVQGCSAAGMAQPRAGDKNVFNVELTFSGTACPLGHGAHVTGIGYYDAFSRQFAIMTLLENGADGFFFLGQK